MLGTRLPMSWLLWKRKLMLWLQPTQTRLGNCSKQGQTLHITGAYYVDRDEDLLKEQHIDKETNSIQTKQKKKNRLIEN